MNAVSNSDALAGIGPALIESVRADRARQARNGGSYFGGGTERQSHGFHEPQYALVADAVEDLVGVLPGFQDAFVTQDREVLGNVALRSTDHVDEILYAGLPGSTQDTQNLQPQWVRHRLERARSVVYVRLAGV